MITRTAPQPPRRLPAIHDGYAIASLILGLTWIGGLGSILAVIFGNISLRAAARDGREGSGLARWGANLGVLGIIAAVIIAFAAWSAASGGS